jgi:hypothetical protein
VTKVYKDISGGKKVNFVVTEEDGHGHNWDQHLAKMQKRLEEEFGLQRAHHDPDYNTYE